MASRRGREHQREGEGIKERERLLKSGRGCQREGEGVSQREGEGVKEL